ncbi:MAG TPA: response regulator [Candidatus Moranbacteria bacterium]|nr:MAG: two component transcriptional regulator [Candidatus Moranbacteria bacterium GW2011_GWC2_45_10]KKT94809.1 MAG: response regulator receiver protein, two-component system, chemotaxis family, response regulator CheY [Parcubacteria group bacterium GW2011_GWC1_45_14]HAV11147.1 response regulator [Candidatus Moranbacteria bacterium]
MVEGIKKIMLVEDDVFIRDIYETKLRQEKFEIVMAENGLDALKKLETFLPDLILLDIVMPYMDGMDFLKEFKKDEKWKDIPIIMLSNLSDKERVMDANTLGVNDYLIKSHFTPSEVVAKINALLER